jgi:hypothetical protein
MKLTTRFFRSAFALAALSLGTHAAAATLVSVDATDQIWGNFSGSIAQGATGGAATLSWKTAGYYWAGNIGLTGSDGKIKFNITTNNDDVYTLFSAGSGNSLIGSTCAGNASGCVTLTSGVPSSLLGAINSVNGGYGICCGGSDLIVNADVSGSVPEPASWVLLIAGFGLTGAAMRRRALAQA